MNRLLVAIDLSPGELDGSRAHELVERDHIDKIQLTHVPTEAEVTRLDDILKKHADARLRLYRLPKDAELTVLAGLTHCRRLTIEHTLEDLSFLASCKKLESLDTLVGPKTEFDALATLPSLESLSIGGTRRSLEGIQSVRGLAALALGIRASELEPLTLLPGLRSLSLDGGGAAPLDVLTRCKKLGHVRVNAIKSYDDDALRPLSRCSSLEFLQLHQLRQVEGVTFLDGSSLHALELTTMNGIASLRGLRKLRLSALGLFDKWTHVRELDLADVGAMTTLERFCIAPIFAKAKNGEEVLSALAQRAENLSDVKKLRHAVALEHNLPLAFIA